MPHHAKVFAANLNHCLDEVDAPSQPNNRAGALSKMLNIPKPQAWSLLQGQQFPDPDLLERIANEFEVDSQWLSGDQNMRACK